MKKIFVFLALGMILLLGTGVFAVSADLSNANPNTDSDVLNKDVEDFVKKVAEKKGILENNIKSVQPVDFNNLPENVDLKNIDDNNLALYEVDSGDNKPTYVITVSEKTYKKTLSSEDYKRSFLNFGSSEIMQTGFLETATGVSTSFEKGYVMPRSGSITAMSTNLEIVKPSGKIEVVIIKNSEPIGFGNSIISDSAGVEKDHDVLSHGIVEFEAGDVISVYVKSDSELKDITTLVEVTTK